MSQAFVRELVAEAEADGAALQELWQRIRALHGSAFGAPGVGIDVDVDELRQEFAELRKHFQMLHEQDMAHMLDRDAHATWRARATRLAVRLDEVSGVSDGHETIAKPLTGTTKVSHQLWV